MSETITKDYDLEERLIDFSIRVLCVVEAMPDTKIGNHVAGQLLRSGTSPAPNYGEAQSAESRNDFIHKMKIVLKELRETRIWLLTIQRKPLIQPIDKLAPLVGESHELISIFAASVSTAEQNRQAKIASRRRKRSPKAQ